MLTQDGISIIYSSVDCSIIEKVKLFVSIRLEITTRKVGDEARMRVSAIADLF